MEERFLQEEEHGAEKSSRFLTKRGLNRSFSGKSFADFDPSRLNGNEFNAEEKLKSKKTIDKLFKEGKSVSQRGFTLVYLCGDLDCFYPAQAGFTVPKKHFKHAVQRNRVKRLMREAYRLNKRAFYEKLVAGKKQIALMFVFKGKSIPDYEVVTKAIVTCLKNIEI